ncbi:hypothetical protein [Sutcliffiella halmapala]|uniref:hypothetical protein n=1 Tax=Sutcliffiella halmapala TaxID=79882 RepID=UPI000994C366|nr:hypothetical protein [Sutcliffiella halmapala]
MIRLFVAALICITIFSIYYDLSNGTIPSINQEQVTTTMSVPDVTEQPSELPNSTNNYIDVEVKAGDTVLTIAERIANKPIPVSITQLIEDFQTLNDGIPPEKIQIGKSYRFPIY